MSASELLATVKTPADVMSLFAAGIAIGLILTSSFVKTMIPLRWLAVGGNVGFVIYGALHPSPVMLVLHGALLPINLWRALEMVHLTRRVTAAAEAGDLSGVWLKPYMRSRRYKAGDVLFHKGDPAGHFYFLAEGRIEFVEIGEIAFFAPDRRRSLTARCLQDCTVLSIDESTFKQLYYQNPAFGFEIVTLVAGRLMADRQRLQHLLGARAPA